MEVPDLPIQGDSETDSDESLRPQPHISWADAVLAQDVACAIAPESYRSLLAYFSNNTPVNLSCEILGARVTRSGDFLLWLGIRFGVPPSAAEAAAGDSRPRFHVQVAVSRTIVEHLGYVDPWASARS